MGRSGVLAPQSGTSFTIFDTFLETKGSGSAHGLQPIAPQEPAAYCCVCSRHHSSVWDFMPSFGHVLCNNILASWNNWSLVNGPSRAPPDNQNIRGRKPTILTLALILVHLTCRSISPSISTSTLGPLEQPKSTTYPQRCCTCTPALLQACTPTDTGSHIAPSSRDMPAGSLKQKSEGCVTYLARDPCTGWAKQDRNQRQTQSKRLKIDTEIGTEKPRIERWMRHNH